MKKKRRIGLAIVALIILTNSMIVFAKTDSATRSFKCTGIDVSGNASVSISSGSFGMNTAKSKGEIFGSELWMTSKEYYYTKVNLNTYLGTNSYKLFNGQETQDISTTEYCMWKATMRVYFAGEELVSWSVSCS